MLGTTFPQSAVFVLRCARTVRSDHRVLEILVVLSRRLVGVGRFIKGIIALTLFIHRTYILGAEVFFVNHNVEIYCTEDQFSTMVAPAGQTCGGE